MNQFQNRTAIVTGAATTLANLGAAAYVCGQVLNVDGGFATAGLFGPR